MGTRTSSRSPPDNQNYAAGNHFPCTYPKATASLFAAATALSVASSMITGSPALPGASVAALNPLTTMMWRSPSLIVGYAMTAILIVVSVLGVDKNYDDGPAGLVHCPTNT
jgi:hypothetical protein